MCHFSPPCLLLFAFSSSLVPFLVSLVSFSAYLTVFYITFLQYNFQFCFGGQFASVSRVLHSPLTQLQFSLAITMSVCFTVLALSLFLLFFLCQISVFNLSQLAFLPFLVFKPRTATLFVSRTTPVS